MPSSLTLKLWYALPVCVLLSATAFAQSGQQKTAAANAQKQAPVAVLRVTCEGDSAGAQVSINGQVKGRCPLDMEIPVGMVKVRATKKDGEDWERVFEDDVEVGSGVIQRVEVVLGSRRIAAATVSRWETASKAGDTKAMYQLGRAYEWGTTGALDFVKATSFYRQAAEAGHSPSMLAYSDAIERGRVAGSGLKEVISWTTKAAESGNGDALFRMGSFYFGGSKGFPNDEEKAKAYYLRGASAGSPYAKKMLSNFEKK